MSDMLFCGVCYDFEYAILVPHQMMVRLTGGFDMADKSYQFNDEERTMVVNALDLAIQSCTRLSNRAGQPVTVKNEYVAQADRLRIVKSKLTLTK